MIEKHTDCQTLGYLIQKQISDIGRIKSLVEKQAQDESLWFLPTRITEAHLQKELRALHESIKTLCPPF